jgi:ribosomal protein S18 acetylase RimI-like enzyme
VTAGAVEIRPAVPADVPDVRAVGVAAWQVAYAGVLPPAEVANGIAEFFNDYSLRAAVRSERMLVAERDGAIVGLLELDRPSAGHAAIWRVCVAPEARRAGVGRALVERALDALAAPAVHVEHDARDAAAAAFFERLGFGVAEVEAGTVRRVRPTPPRATTAST